MTLPPNMAAISIILTPATTTKPATRPFLPQRGVGTGTAILNPAKGYSIPFGSNAYDHPTRNGAAAEPQICVMNLHIASPPPSAAQILGGFFYVQDVRYAAGAGMRRSGACTGCTVCRGRRDAQERRMYRMYGMPRAQGCAGAAMYRMYGQEIALGNCSCIALTPTSL